MHCSTHILKKAEIPMKIACIALLTRVRLFPGTGGLPASPHTLRDTVPPA